MRVLFSFIGGHGHFVPLVPIARAAAAAGHVVAFGSGIVEQDTVKAAGFESYVVDEDRGPPPKLLPLRPLDYSRDQQNFGRSFARIGARARVPRVLALCEEWRPDIVVCDEADFGAMIAAERAEVPYATVLVMAAGSIINKDIIREPLTELRVEYGLSSDVDLVMLRRHLVLSPFPPCLRDPEHPVPDNTQFFRALNETPVKTSPPPWLLSLMERPVVYFTLGTLFGMASGDLFVRVLAALADLELSIVVTVGPSFDPAELGPQPSHVRIERYIPQHTLVPHCQLVITHGGSGTILGALGYGIPLLVLPIAADQIANARQCAAIGVGEMLDPNELEPSSLRAAVSRLLTESEYRRAAEAARREIWSLPKPEDALRKVVELVGAQSSALPFGRPQLERM